MLLYYVSCTLYIVSVEHRCVGFVHTRAAFHSTQFGEADQSEYVLPGRVHRRYAFRDYNTDNRQSGRNRWVCIKQFINYILLIRLFAMYV